jgi:N-acetylglucosaminyl-diphospho-decaprenol L-rhamnosyltransferase
VTDTPITVLLVNWNCGDLLTTCVRSVLANGCERRLTVLVIDNASTDGSLERLIEDLHHLMGDPGVLRILRNDCNEGFARAVNRGLRAAQTPLILVLNPDTEVRSGALDAMARALATHPKAGACAPKLLFPDGSLQFSVWPNPPTPAYVLLEGLHLSSLLPKSVRAAYLLGRHWNHDEPREVPSFSGAAFMVKRELIETIGALDERFDFYGEDAEFCLRVLRSGWKLIFEPAAQVVHHGGHSARQRWVADELRLREVAAHVAFQQRCLSPWLVLANALASALVLGVTALWQLLRRREARLSWAAWRLQAQAASWALKRLAGPPAPPGSGGPPRVELND